MPTLDHEGALLAGARVVVGMDEVGRGAWAGPVCVGAVAVTSGTGPPPHGLNDSKELSPARRESLAPQVRAWARDAALGWAGADEVDSLGITGALRAAGQRAMKALGELCCQVGDVIVLLDGAHDWLSPPPVTLLEATCPPDIESRRWRVKTLVGADHLAAGVAGASVLAKCARDAEMGRLARRHPGYGWERNMGYGTPGHRQAIATLGMSPQHRRTWKLAVE